MTRMELETTCPLIPHHQPNDTGSPETDSRVEFDILWYTTYIGIGALLQYTTLPQEVHELVSPSTCFRLLSNMLSNFPSVKLLRLCWISWRCVVLCCGGKSRGRTRPYHSSPSVGPLSSLPHAPPLPSCPRLPLDVISSRLWLLIPQLLYSKNNN